MASLFTQTLSSIRPLAMVAGLSVLALSPSVRAMDTAPVTAPMTAPTPEPELSARAMASARTPQDLTAKDLSDARALIKKQRWSEAIEVLKPAAARSPDNADVQNLLGFTHRKSGQLRRAFEYYEVALRLSPNTPEIHEYVGEAYLMDKRPDKAEEHLAILARLCDQCEPYRELSESIEAYKRTHKKP